MSKISGFITSKDLNGTTATIKYLPPGSTIKQTIEILDSNGFTKIGDLIVAKQLSTKIDGKRFKVIEIIG